MSELSMVRRKKARRFRPFVIILTVITMILVSSMAVSYAQWTRTLGLSGSVNASAKIDVVFSSASVTSSLGVSGTPTAEVNGGTLTINVDKLNYAGAGLQVTAVIRNNSTFRVEPIGTVSVSYMGGTDPDNNGTGIYNDFDVNLTQSNGTTPVSLIALNPGDTQTVYITMRGKSSMTATKYYGKYTFALNYEQDTVAFVPSPSHN